VPVLFDLSGVEQQPHNGPAEPTLVLALIVGTKAEFPSNMRIFQPVRMLGEKLDNCILQEPEAFFRFLLQHDPGSPFRGHQRYSVLYAWYRNQ
jgi:hypothetical protein